MDPKNLKYFVAVAQYGSINAAAKAMFISQPQLSHIIKSIEEDVGFELFQRKRNFRCRIETCIVAIMAAEITPSIKV